MENGNKQQNISNAIVTTGAKLLEDSKHPPTEPDPEDVFTPEQMDVLRAEILAAFAPDQAADVPPSTYTALCKMISEEVSRQLRDSSGIVSAREYIRLAGKTHDGRSIRGMLYFEETEEGKSAAD